MKNAFEASELRDFIWPLSAAGWDPQAHLLVEEDPEEIRRRGEELFPQAELAGGEPDARVDGSRCAARGGNL